MVLSGSVDRSAVGVGSDVAPVLAWYDWYKEGTGYFQTVDFSGEFPSRFTLRLYEPPPAAALTQPKENWPRSGMARLFALRAGQTWTADAFSKNAAGLPDWFLGAVGNFLVLYLEGPAPAKPYFLSESAAGLPLARGFHLIRLTERTAEEAAQRDQCFDSARTTAIAKTNEKHGSAYSSIDEMPEDMLQDFAVFYSELKPACGSKVKMTVVDTDVDRELLLQIGMQVDWVDWF